MKIAVLGTGGVGRTFVVRLLELGHEVVMGTRDVSAKLASDEADPYGGSSFKEWYASQTEIELANFKDAVASSEMIINATSGQATLSIFAEIGSDVLGEKIVIDVSNPLDFSNGIPPTLFVSNTDSLAEQLQAQHPNLRVVKSLNTMNANLMVNPALLSEAHDVFVSGNSAEAKAKVIALLGEFGWQSPIDLGDIRSARGVEMILPIWLELMSTLQTPLFNFKIVRA